MGVRNCSQAPQAPPASPNPRQHHRGATPRTPQTTSSSLPATRSPCRLLILILSLKHLRKSTTYLVPVRIHGRRPRTFSILKIKGIKRKRDCPKLPDSVRLGPKRRLASPQLLGSFSLAAGAGSRLDCTWGRGAIADNPRPVATNHHSQGHNTNRIRSLH